jgi:hypothetical protein
MTDWENHLKIWESKGAGRSGLSRDCRSCCLLVMLRKEEREVVPVYHLFEEAVESESVEASFQVD